MTIILLLLAVYCCHGNVVVALLEVLTSSIRKVLSIISTAADIAVINVILFQKCYCQPFSTLITFFYLYPSVRVSCCGRLFACLINMQFISTSNNIAVVRSKGD